LGNRLRLFAAHLGIIGASGQTGWTALALDLILESRRDDSAGGR
jgi:hypothetical protein